MSSQSPANFKLLLHSVAAHSCFLVLNLVYLFWHTYSGSLQGFLISVWTEHLEPKTSPRIDFNLGVALKIPLTYCSEQGYHPHLGLSSNDPRYPCLLALRDSWVWSHTAHIPCVSWFAL
ncbi:hypothetical protein K445DRAFT_126504 [Daldinia sp. EC12]|nr:hypothetical protein K445DRAFT_126504 [Daldinia sp. EC12]